MRLAILTDIHANREALEAVLADATGMRIDRFAILGDIVGYGPDPDWCIDKVADLQARGAITVRGNHDRAIGVRYSGCVTSQIVAKPPVCSFSPKVKPSISSPVAGLICMARSFQKPLTRRAASASGRPALRTLRAVVALS